MPKHPLAPLWLFAAATLALAVGAAGATRGADPHAPAGPPATQPAHPGHDGPAAHPAHDPYSTDEVLEILHQANPQLEQRVRAALKDNPDRVKELVGRVAMGKLKAILDRKRNDPQMYQLMVQEYRINTLTDEQTALARAATDPAARGQARDRLADLLRQDFAVHQQIDQVEIKRLTERLADLQKQIDAKTKDLEARANDQDKIVADRLQHLLPADADKPAPKK
jgi:hypothetical protein